MEVNEKIPMKGIQKQILIVVIRTIYILSGVFNKFLTNDILIAAIKFRHIFAFYLSGTNGN